MRDYEFLELALTAFCTALRKHLVQPCREPHHTQPDREPLSEDTASVGSHSGSCYQKMSHYKETEYESNFLNA